MSTPLHVPNSNGLLNSTNSGYSGNEGNEENWKAVNYPSLSYEHFEGLPYSDRMAYFNSLIDALRHLQGSRRCIPRIDDAIFQNYDQDNRLNAAELEAAEYLQEVIARKWSLVQVSSTNTVSGNTYPKASGQVRWSDDYLRWSPKKSQLELASPLERDGESLLRYQSFHSHISSSLLLYRLNILIQDLEGYTPDHTECCWDATDQYKCSWDISIHHSESGSTLRLWDSKGGARAAFYGSREAGNDALELINFLTGVKFPHTYDGLIAGTVA